MYLCHYVNNQNGPTLLRGGEGERGGIVVYYTAEPKKKHLKPQQKFAKSRKSHPKPSKPIFHILGVKTLIDPIQLTDGAQRGFTAK